MIGKFSLIFFLFFIGQAYAAKPVEHYFKKPEFAQMALSPDGKYLGALAPIENRMNLIVLDLETYKSQAVTSIKKQDVSNFIWASNDRLLFFMDDDGNESFGIFAVNKDGSKPRTLVKPAKEKMSGGSFVLRQTAVLDLLEDDPEHILVTSNEKRAAYPDVYKMNIFTGRKKMHERNFGNVVGWITDHNGEVRGAGEQDGLISRSWYKNPKTGEWEKIAESVFPEPGFGPAGISYDGKTLYMLSYLTENGETRDKAGLYTYDLETRKMGELLFEHDEVDVGGISFSDKKKKLIAVSYYTDKPHVHYFDQDFTALQATVDAALKGTRNSISSMNKEENLAIITAWSDTQPGIYYLYDLEKKVIKELASSREWIKPEEMAEMKPVKFKARDGLTLNGYLTVPPGSDGKNLPLVINPHGGPWARDSWGFNPETQFLANRGYAVMQVNFRGSTGYGREFLHASYKKWGLSMQDDISDAVQWAVDQGIVDKERVCIYGGSYGGYATMAGLTYTPELYKCGINYVGVTSIPLLFETMPKTWEAAREQFKIQAGDPEKDRELLEDRSPSNHADKIQAPLLMAYGKRDPRVVLKHAKIMAKEMDKHDKPYELIIKKDEGHGFRKFENQVEFYGRMANFLDEHIGE